MMKTSAQAQPEVQPQPQQPLGFDAITLNQLNEFEGRLNQRFDRLDQKFDGLIQQQRQLSLQMQNVQQMLDCRNNTGSVEALGACIYDSLRGCSERESMRRSQEEQSYARGLIYSDYANYNSDEDSDWQAASDDPSGGD